MVLSLLALAPTGSCARAGQATQSAALSTSDTLTGRIELTGSQPTAAVTLILVSGESFELRGPLLGELRALAATTVRVIGRRASGSPRRDFDVTEYELLAVDGERPIVGTLALREAAVWLEGVDTVQLSLVPPLLVSKIGAKVWIVGRRTRDAVQVQSFGVIRER